MLRVLYVGSIYPVEYSLFRENAGNSEIEVFFAVSSSNGCMPGIAVGGNNMAVVSSREEIDSIKNRFKPDLTIFRRWNATDSFVQEGEVSWFSEIDPKFSKDESIVYDFSNFKSHVAHISMPIADKCELLWFPYCVSKYCEIPKKEKSIPVMLATSIPESVMIPKLRSLDILAKPIIDYDPSLLHSYIGYWGGLEKIDYLVPTIKPSFDAGDMIDKTASCKIYISPTSIWYDEGCISYKTLQAMACGVLTMTNKYVGIEDMLGKDGDTIVYSNSPEETLEKVKFYLGNEEERERVSKRGYEFVHDTYDWGDRLVALYENINI